MLFFFFFIFESRYESRNEGQKRKDEKTKKPREGGGEKTQEISSNSCLEAELSKKYQSLAESDQLMWPHSEYIQHFLSASRRWRF